MRVMNAVETAEALPYPALIEALRDMFRSGCEMPLRHHHTVAVPGEPDATLLLMPAWVPGRYMGVKLVSVFPGNVTRGLPSISGQYMLSDATTGAGLALLDGAVLTARRTAAASALAADYLARRDAGHLVIVGTGSLSRALAEAHSQVRPIRKVTVWGRRAEAAEAVAADLRATLGCEALATTDLEGAVRRADIVSAATMSQTPLVLGEWLAEGCHVDLVGAYKPTMRESDDTAIRRARVHVDTRAGAMKEGGDIALPLASGVLSAEAIAGDLYDLTRGLAPGRQTAAEITLFKSVGAALEDLAGAILAFEASTAAKAQTQ
ncbi:ornithine cyclodeaminase family protein [Microvirga tunisiensis]|uniref:Ornithine cyclodeaminase family protein n=2 Tax=Pannonibacter tanglangensis TaxID=2750084 RepID=A0A7X5F1L9_9HYPH|nr:MULTISPECIES: ornithine cyclodeaminase family protein [unclassified Pannonibacter]NBN62454.1 ornithine cyclodeaminase family protein [Pannonibacter sp. XCT-34]NBN78110.1 ornithine cyclodeaminase family protein [Pannonibacter sp. XCT-53]